MQTHFTSSEQARRYFMGRPHVGMPPGPIAHRAAWRGDEIRAELGNPHNDILHVFTQAELDAVETALAQARATGKPTLQLTRADFPLPTLEPLLQRWRTELGEGRGFALARGVPVGRWPLADAERFFWCLGQHLGTPGLQNPQGDLLGRVTDTGDARNDPLVRLYRTSANINYHCDGADVVGLLCLRTAERGGASRIASSVTVFNELLVSRPDIAARLFGQIRMDRRNEERPGDRPWTTLQPACWDGRQLRTFYHSDYFRSVVRHVGPLPPAEQELLDAYEAIAERPDIRFEMQFQPGDIQLLSNHTVVHARTAYDDGARGKRELLRLWLSLDRGAGPG